jgi:hypothetical protein
MSSAESSTLVQIKVNCPWAENMEFVQTAFDYQKEALELRHAQEISHLTQDKKARYFEKITAKRLEPIETINRNLHLEYHEITKHDEKLEIELKKTKTEIWDIEQRIKKLDEMALTMAYCGLRYQPIPSDVMLELKKEMEIMKVFNTVRVFVH